MVSWYITALAILLGAQRGIELYIAARNRRWSLAQGAVETGSRHYPLFFLLHGTWFLGWMAEGLANNQIAGLWFLWLSLLAAAQGLRYWCIASLGNQWNTRILVIPGARMIHKGPYRIMAHPNYLAVAIELFCVPMLFGALYTAILATAFNAGLLFFVRLPAERQALHMLN